MLSAETAKTIQELGQTLLVAYACDNFDVELKMGVPVVEKFEDKLKHLTSALMFPLQHGVTLDNLRCSDELWSKSSNNTNAAHQPPLDDSTDLLMKLHPKPPSHLSPGPDKLTCHDHFNQWKFLTNLCDHGPEYFSQFQSQIGDAEVIEGIPVIQTPITPMCTIEYSNSSVAGNISTIIDILVQSGIGDSNDPASKYEVVDLNPYVIIFFGDLGTGEQIQNILQCRAIEEDSYNQFQYVIFVPGLFHAKMACADAIWRIAI